MLLRGGKQRPWHMAGPKPKKSTRFRLIGPIPTERGNKWRVWDFYKREQFGPDCDSIMEGRQVLDDAVSGRVVTYVGKVRLVAKDIMADMVVGDDGDT